MIDQNGLGAHTTAVGVVRQELEGAGLTFEEPSSGEFVVELPGEKKLRTTVSLSVQKHALTVNAFVARKPDENQEAVFRWLLERNRKIFGVGYALDHLGDIYLVGRLPLAAITPESLDQLLGSVLTAADGDFNTILELGFESAIRAEWRWRLERGESTRNLAAFEHLAPSGTDTEQDDAG